MFLVRLSHKKMLQHEKYKDIRLVKTAPATTHIISQCINLYFIRLI